MSAVLEKPTCTPEELLSMPDGERFELVDGQLVEREMGLLSGIVGAQVVRLIGNYALERSLGWPVNSEVGYQCFPWTPEKVRRPDASFISGERLSAEQLDVGFVRIPPDLAIEVVSPSDLFAEVVQKAEEYLRAHVRLVWVVDPGTRTVYVYRADNTLSRLQEEDELSGEDVLPGFRCRVADLFPPRAESAAADAVVG